jgi:hypothetical protein
MKELYIIKVVCDNCIALPLFSTLITPVFLTLQICPCFFDSKLQPAPVSQLCKLLVNNEPRKKCLEKNKGEKTILPIPYPKHMASSTPLFP